MSRADRRHAPGPRPGDLRLRGRRPDRRSRARPPASTRCSTGSDPSSRARCCSPTSTSTTRAPPGVLCRRFPELAGVRARARRAAPDRPVEAAGERGAPVRRRHGAALGRGGAGARGAHPRRCRAARPSRASAWPTRPATPRTTSAYLHEDTGDAYVGDVAGVRIPPHEHTRARPRRRPTSTWRRGSTRSHTRRGVEPAGALPHPLRPGRPTWPSSCTGSATRCASRRDSRPRSTARRASSPSCETRLAERHRPGDGRGLRAGRAARPALPGPRALLAQAREARPHERRDRSSCRASAGPGSGLGGNWRVIVLNDDHNTFEGVAAALLADAPGRQLRPGHGDGQHASTTPARRSSGRAPASPPSSTGSSSRTPGSRWPRWSRARRLRARRLGRSPAPTISWKVGSSGTW